jgi:antitoxin PrlF
MPRMTSKGQVTIPKRVRDYLGLKPGSEVEFVVVGDGQIGLRTKANPEKGRFDNLVGTLDLGMTTDEFMRMLRGDPEEDPKV